MSAAAEPTSVDALTPGQVVAGRYRIVTRIGQGGIAQVYRAEHLYIRTDVAIKVLMPGGDCHLGDSRRFEREAFALGLVAHDNILTVTDFVVENGQRLLVTEFLNGPTLGDVLDGEERLPLARTLDILAQLLRGLGHAHRQGVVHRDLKPDNLLLVEKDGRKDVVKVVDFGLAKLIGEVRDGVGDLTETGVTFGTPRYMAPEQALGKPVDGRTDLYAVAAMAYRMLAGRAPFIETEPHELLMAHCTRLAPTFAEIGVHDVPGAVEAVIRRGLAKDPELRYADACAMLDALDHAVAAEPALVETRAVRRRPRPAFAPTVAAAPAKPPVASPAPPRSLDRKKMGIAMMAGVALLLVVGLVASSSSSAVEVTTIEAPAQPADDAKVAASDIVIHQDELADVRALIADGRNDQAIDRLMPRVRSGQHDGEAALLLGHLYIRKMYWSDGFEAYEKAIARNPALADHPVLIANAVAGLGSQSRPGLARRFIRTHLGKRALGALDDAAKTAKHKHHRERAEALARELRGRGADAAPVTGRTRTVVVL